MARKYSPQNSGISGSGLFNPAVNIELGTAYMREQLSKYGRIEFMAVAYNAGPGRVNSWQKTLPYEMDEFVEEIPFKETKGYVQGNYPQLGAISQTLRRQRKFQIKRRHKTTARRD